MNHIKLETISDQIVLFIYKYAYHEKDFAKMIDISPHTLSRRLKMNDWRFDEIRAIKRVFKNKGLKLIV